MTTEVQVLTKLHSITPFFIVDDLQTSLDFYCSKLGFEVAYKGPGEEQGGDYWGFVQRDDVMIMLKHITPEIHPQPSSSRHAWIGWDAYIYTSDPDALYAECVSRSAPIHKELGDTTDRLRAFEIIDNSGYVLCFGRPIL
ncbi:MAG TPA: VOC family protein [Acidobacteriaceae bacterium]|jgi:uncharacterized glyoxalase superfamily protein PhnB|nr:VOC family protein [Acidobacteriaceae bacterium]